jgi:hypothetical protein
MEWPVAVALVLVWAISVVCIYRDEAITDRHRGMFVVGAVVVPGAVIYYWVWKLSKVGQRSPAG